MKTFIKIMLAAIIAVFIGGAISIATGFHPAITMGFWFALAFVPRKFIPVGVLQMAVQVEIWEKDIEEDLFKDNTFLNDAYNADQYVLQGAVVHIPQSGGSGNVVKNRSTLPATIRRRDDTDITYPLDEYTTDPVVIPDADIAQLSYDKRNSVVGEDKNALFQSVAEEALYKWAENLPVVSIVSTSGAVLPATSEGATGTRKGATRTDLQKMRSLLVKQNKWTDGQMHALIPSDMLAQMFPADDVITATYSANLTEEERREGIVYKTSGFKIKERGTVLRYATDGTLKSQEALGEATDNEGALFWEKNAVERALGTVKMFDKIGDPTMYGDVFSFLLRFGGRRRRKDNKGVVVLRQQG